MVEKRTKEYYEANAAASRASAEAETDPSIRAIHVEMASTYDIRAAGTVRCFTTLSDGTVLI